MIKSWIPRIIKTFSVQKKWWRGNMTSSGAHEKKRGCSGKAMQHNYLLTFDKANGGTGGSSRLKSKHKQRREPSEVRRSCPMFIQHTWWNIWRVLWLGWQQLGQWLESLWALSWYVSESPNLLRVAAEKGARRAGDDQIKGGIEVRGGEKENGDRGWDDSDDDADSIADRVICWGHEFESKEKARWRSRITSFSEVIFQPSLGFNWFTELSDFVFV